MSDKPVFIVVHKDCGHLACATNDQRIANATQAMLQRHGKWAWRIRVGATDGELASLLREERCDTCRADVPHA